MGVNHVEGAHMWHYYFNRKACQQKITKQWFQDLWVDLNWNIALLLNESDILSLGHDLSGGLIKKNTNPSLVFKLLPLKITIDIPIIILYIIKLQLLKYGLRVVTSNMQTLIRFDLEYEVGKEFKKKNYE